MSRKIGTFDPRLHLEDAQVLTWAAVSTKIQDKYSIDDQLKLERDWCEKHGCNVVEELVVRGFSRDYWTLADVVAAAAHDPDMEAFAKLQAHIRKKSFTVFLCFDADRFGRTQSLVHEVIGRVTRDCNALIYTLFDGVWMDAESGSTIGTFKAMKAQQDIDKLKGYRATGMDNRAQDGKSTSAFPPIFHKRVRNEKGKEVGVIVNEDLRPLWTDLAILILRGVSWMTMEQVLYDEFGHSRNGKPYPTDYMRHIVLHYAFWGHAAVNYRSKGGEFVAQVGPWIWDESVPSPDVTTVYRNRFPAVYSGQWAELGEQVKTELWRRYRLRGKASSTNTFRFHGLIVCDQCGYSMNKSINSKDRNRIYMRCETRYGSFRRRAVGCDQNKFIRCEEIQDFFHREIQNKLDGAPSRLFDTLENTEGIQKLIDEETTRVEHLTRKRTVLIDEQSEADLDARASYRLQITDVSNQIRRSKELSSEYESKLTSDQEEREAQGRFLEMMREKGVPWLWTQPDTFIHQSLAAALGKNQVVVRDGEIKGVIPARARQVLKNRRESL